MLTNEPRRLTSLGIRPMRNYKRREGSQSFICNFMFIFCIPPLSESIWTTVPYLSSPSTHDAIFPQRFLKAARNVSQNASSTVRTCKVFRHSTSKSLVPLFCRPCIQAWSAIGLTTGKMCNSLICVKIIRSCLQGGNPYLRHC
jgi:hypothetical protein